MNDFATFDMLPFIPLHFLCTQVRERDNVKKACADAYIAFFPKANRQILAAQPNAPQKQFKYSLFEPSF